MKLTPILLLLTFTIKSISAYSQKVLYYKMYNKAGDSVSDYKHAYSFEKHERINDSLFIKKFYQTNGPCIKLESYKDISSTQKSSLFTWYNLDGNLDSLKYYNKNEIQYEFNCSIKTTATNSSKSRCSPNLDSVLIKNDLPQNTSIPNRISSFKGDALQFFYNNFRYPEYSNIKQIRGNAIVSFIINEKGKVILPIMIKSLEYNIDNEILRVIKKTSGKWLPSIENHSLSTSNHIQEINIIR